MNSLQLFNYTVSERLEFYGSFFNRPHNIKISDIGEHIYCSGCKKRMIIRVIQYVLQDYIYDTNNGTPSLKINIDKVTIDRLEYLHHCKQCKLIYCDACIFPPKYHKQCIQCGGLGCCTVHTFCVICGQDLALLHLCQYCVAEYICDNCNDEKNSVIGCIKHILCIS